MVAPSMPDWSQSAEQLKKQFVHMEKFITTKMVNVTEKMVPL